MRPRPRSPDAWLSEDLTGGVFSAGSGHLTNYHRPGCGDDREFRRRRGRGPAGLASGLRTALRRRLARTPIPAEQGHASGPASPADIPTPGGARVWSRHSVRGRPGGPGQRNAPEEGRQGRAGGCPQAPRPPLQPASGRRCQSWAAPLCAHAQLPSGPGDPGEGRRPRGGRRQRSRAGKVLGDGLRGETPGRREGSPARGETREAARAERSAVDRAGKDCRCAHGAARVGPQGIVPARKSPPQRPARCEAARFTFSEGRPCGGGAQLSVGAAGAAGESGAGGPTVKGRPREAPAATGQLCPLLVVLPRTPTGENGSELDTRRCLLGLGPRCGSARREREGARRAAHGPPLCRLTCWDPENAQDEAGPRKAMAIGGAASGRRPGADAKAP